MVNLNGSQFNNMADEFQPDSTVPVDQTAPTPQQQVDFQPASTEPIPQDQQTVLDAKQHLDQYYSGQQDDYTHDDIANLENIVAQGQPITERGASDVAGLAGKIWDNLTDEKIGNAMSGVRSWLNNNFTAQNLKDTINDFVLGNKAKEAGIGLLSGMPQIPALMSSAIEKGGEIAGEMLPGVQNIRDLGLGAPIDQAEAHARAINDLIQHEVNKGSSELAQNNGVSEDAALYQVNKQLPILFLGGPEIGVDKLIASGVKNSLNLANRTLSGAQALAGISAPYAATAAKALTIDKLLGAVGFSSGTQGIDELLSILGATKGGTQLSNPALVDKLSQILLKQPLKDVIEDGKIGFLNGGGEGGVNGARAIAADQKAASLQEEASSALEKLSPEDQSLVNDTKSDGTFMTPDEDLSPDLRKIRDKVNDISDLNKKAQALRTQSFLGKSIEDTLQYLGGIAGTTALGAGAGTAFEELSSPTGAPLTGTGTTLGGILGLAYAPLGAARGMVDLRMQEGLSKLLARGEGKIDPEDLQGLNPSQVTHLTKYAGALDALGKKLFPVSPSELLEARRAALPQGQSLPSDTKPGYGWVSPDGDIYVNKNALGSRVTQHEFTHAMQNFFGETLDKLTPEQMAEFEKQYGAAKKMSGGGSFSSARERDAEVGRLVLTHTPLEYFVGGERPYDVLRKTWDGLFGDKGIKTIGGFEAPYIPAKDIPAMQQRIYKAMQEVGKPPVEKPFTSGGTPQGIEAPIKGATPFEEAMPEPGEPPPPGDYWMDKEGNFTPVGFRQMHDDVAKKMIDSGQVPAATDENVTPSEQMFRNGYSRIVHYPQSKQIFVQMPKEFGQLSGAQSKALSDQAIWHDYNRVMLDKGFLAPEKAQVLYDKSDWDMMPEPVEKPQDLKPSDLVSVAGNTKVIKGIVGNKMLFADGSSQEFNPDVRVYKWSAPGYVHPSEREPGVPPLKPEELAQQRQDIMNSALDIRKQLAERGYKGGLGGGKYELSPSEQIFNKVSENVASAIDKAFQFITGGSGESPMVETLKDVFKDYLGEPEEFRQRFGTHKLEDLPDLPPEQRPGFKGEGEQMPEKSQAWMDEHGNEVTFEKEPHRDVAKRIIGVKRYAETPEQPPEQTLYNKGHAAVVSYPGNKALYLRKPLESGPITPDQIQSAIETAKNKGYKHLFLDTGKNDLNFFHPVWSEGGELMPSDDVFGNLINKWAEEDEAENKSRKKGIHRIYGWMDKNGGYQEAQQFGHIDLAQKILNNPSARYDDMFKRGWIRLESTKAGGTLHVDRVPTYGGEKAEITPSQLYELRNLAKENKYRSVFDDASGRQLYRGRDDLSPEYGYMGDANEENARGRRVYSGDLGTHSIYGYGRNGRNWRYNPETKQVYWWDRLPNEEIRNSAEEFLGKQGESPEGHKVLTAGMDDKLFREAHFRGRLDWPGASFGDLLQPEYGYLGDVDENGNAKGSKFYKGNEETHAGHGFDSQDFSKKWRYNPETKQVYWWKKPSSDSIDAVRNFLDKKGEKVEGNKIIGGTGGMFDSPEARSMFIRNFSESHLGDFDMMPESQLPPSKFPMSLEEADDLQNNMRYSQFGKGLQSQEVDNRTKLIGRGKKVLTENRGDLHGNYLTTDLMPETKTGKDIQDKGYDFQFKQKGNRGSIVVNSTENRPEGKQLAGFLDFHVNPGGRAFVELANVREPFRRQGIGEAMYHELRNYLQDKGVTTLDGDIISPAAEGLRSKHAEEVSHATSNIPPDYDFMPEPNNPEALERTAIRRNSDGKIFVTKGNYNQPHQNFANEFPELSDMNTYGALKNNKYEHGFVDGNGNFLDVGQAYDRAIDVGQDFGTLKYKHEIHSDELMPNYPPTLNIGDQPDVTEAKIRKSLPIKPIKISHFPSTTGKEGTFVVTLPRQLSDEDANKLSSDLGQEAIAQHSGNQGALHGPGKEKWEPFNPDYFITQQGLPITHPDLREITNSSGAWDSTFVDGEGYQKRYEIAKKLGVDPSKHFSEQPDEAQAKIRDYFTSSGEADFMPEWMPRNVKKYITPDEEKLLDNTANSFNRFMNIWSNKPTIATGVKYAQLGAEGKGWYDEVAQKIVDIFRQDANRFAALTASFSPNTPVEPNIEMALGTWDNWLKMGRPTDQESIRTAVQNGIQDALVRLRASGESATVAAGFNTYFKNAYRTLSAADASPSALKLSGPKVDSYKGNLSVDPDVLREVTNDTHIAQYISQDPQANYNLFGRKEIGGMLVKTPEYIASSAHIRQVADKLTSITGETWTPRQAQAAIWSYILKKQGRGPERRAGKSSVTQIPSYMNALNRWSDMQVPDEPF